MSSWGSINGYCSNGSGIFAIKDNRSAKRVIKAVELIQRNEMEAT